MNITTHTPHHTHKDTPTARRTKTETRPLHAPQTQGSHEPQHQPTASRRGRLEAAHLREVPRATSLERPVRGSTQPGDNAGVGHPAKKKNATNMAADKRKVRPPEQENDVGEFQAGCQLSPPPPPLYGMENQNSAVNCQARITSSRIFSLLGVKSHCRNELAGVTAG